MNIKDFSEEQLKDVLSKIFTKKVIFSIIVVADILTLIFIFTVFLCINIFVSINFFAVFFIWIALGRLYKYYKISKIDDSALGMTKDIIFNLIDNIQVRASK